MPKRWKLVVQMPVGLLHWLMLPLLLLWGMHDVSNSFAPSLSVCRSGSLSSSGTGFHSVRNVLTATARTIYFSFFLQKGSMVLSLKRWNTSSFPASHVLPFMPILS